MAGLSEILKDCIDYDHCLVFPTNEYNDFTDRGKMYMENIQALGYETYIFKVEGKRKISYFECLFGISENDDFTDENASISVGNEDQELQTTEQKKTYKRTNTLETMKKRPSDQECIIFVLLRTPLHKLREFAERMELRMLLDPEKSKELLAEGDPEHNIRRVVLKHDPEISNLPPYDCIYAKYRKNREFLYWKGDDYHKGQDNFISTDNISRYYSNYHLPIYETKTSFYAEPTQSSVTEEEAEDEEQSEVSSPAQNRPNAYRFSYLSGSISTYNLDHKGNAARNFHNSALLRNHPFRDLLRIKISNFMLESRPRIIRQNYVLSTMNNLKIKRLLNKKRLLGSFVLHNPAKTMFQTTWAKYPFHPQPIYEIKEYFGEKFAFFYAFLDHYTISLFIPMLIALPLQICVFAFDNYAGNSCFGVIFLRFLFNLFLF